LRSYRLSVSRDGERCAIFARRGRLGIFGAYVTHLGIIFLLIGGIFIARFGTRSLAHGRVGDIISAPDRSFRVRIDDLELELNPHGQVKDWFSTLTVLDPDSVLTKRIEVNDPLRYKGIRFYQSDWAQARDQVRSVTLEIEPRAGTDASFGREVPFGQKVALPRIGRTVRVTRFVANFVMNADGRIASRSDQPSNPAIQLEVYKDETKTSDRWLFLRYPEFHQGEVDPVYAFRFLDYEPVYITGIEISKAPGSILVWIGFGLTSLGIFLAFFVMHRRIWALMESDGEQETRGWIGGLADKNKAGFEREFKRIVRHLREKL
jgi:cytochrome c biogenesis protein